MRFVPRFPILETSIKRVVAGGDVAVKQVVLSHLSTGLDGEDADRTHATGVRQNFKGPVTVARDLQVFTLGSSGE